MKQAEVDIGGGVIRVAITLHGGSGLTARIEGPLRKLFIREIVHLKESEQCIPKEPRVASIVGSPFSFIEVGIQRGRLVHPLDGAGTRACLDALRQKPPLVVCRDLP